MLLAVPATTGEAEESSRSSKQHSSSRSSKQQGSPWRIEVIVVRPLCPDPSVPNVRSVRKCPGLPLVVPLWCPRNPQVSRNNQQCWGSVPRDSGVCVCVTLVLRHLLGQDWLNWAADQQWLRITRNSDWDGFVIEVVDNNIEVIMNKKGSLTRSGRGLLNPY